MRTPPADLRLYYIQRPAPRIANVPAPQTYFPSLETLFPSVVEKPTGTPTLAATELALDISGDTAIVENLLDHSQRTVPIWTRRTHLVNPLDVYEGLNTLPTDGALPSFRTPWQSTLHKINDPYNEAYTDAVFACMASRLVETGRSPHFCRFYGTFNGRVPSYTYNITDDMADVEGEPWFADGLKRGDFKVYAVDPCDPDLCAELTQPWEDVRRKIAALGAGDEESLSSDSSSEIDISSDEDSRSESKDRTVSSLSEKDSTIGDDESLIEDADIDLEEGEPVVVNRRRARIRLERLDSSVGSTASSEESDLEFRLVAPNFPVQITVLERADGTMDNLMEDEIADDATADMRETKEQRWTAWIFQVIAGLTTAQQFYDFVHNDLHTNNVVWTGTGQTHLYYHVTGAAGGDRYYRVPTYGRIFKLIDFGRATFRPPATAAKKGNQTWFPDAYAPDADAAGQYNCGPYFDQTKPKVLPNKSFDLCRLAAAILDTLWQEDPVATEPRKVLTREHGRHQPETVSPLWNLMWLWLTDHEGKNILRTPDDRERYPAFDLYCAIARDAVNAVPAQQLTLPMFDSVFHCRRRDIPADATIYKLQAVHRS